MAREALTASFSAWVGNLAKKGTLPTLESLKDLRTAFVEELLLTDKGRASTDEDASAGAGKRGGRGRRSESEPWSVEAGGKGLRRTFTNV